MALRWKRDQIQTAARIIHTLESPFRHMHRLTGSEREALEKRAEAILIHAEQHNGLTRDDITTKPGLLP